MLSRRNPLNLCGESFLARASPDTAVINGYRFDYNPETFTLRVSPIPNAAHDELHDFIHKSMNRFCRRNIITEAEEDQLHIGSGNEIHLPGRAKTAQPGRTTPAFVKQPDMFIGLKDDGETIFPRVIFEVAFSQNYDEVTDDVNQWLVRSEGRIPLVVLINIEEHPIPRPALADDNTNSDDEYSDGTVDSDVEMYQRLRNCCNVDRVVGPLSAFAEMYRLGPAGVYRVGARIVSPPRLLPRTPLTTVEHHLAAGDCPGSGSGQYPPEHHRPAPQRCGRPRAGL